MLFVWPSARLVSGPILRFASAAQRIVKPAMVLPNISVFHVILISTLTNTGVYTVAAP